MTLLDKLSVAARTATTLPHLQSSSIISLEQVCDDFLDKHKLVALKNKNLVCKYKNTDVVLKGDLNRGDGLWNIEFPIKKTYQPQWIELKRNYNK